MKVDIRRCNEQKDAEGSQELFEQLIAKYSAYDKDFSKNIQFSGKLTVPGYPNDYRRELKNVASKLNFYILNDPAENTNENDGELVIKIFSNFIEASETLQNRKHNKQDFIISDEYDVQDLMHAFLKLYFDDVRSEEWTPSYAGGSVRQDFILKQQKIVIETKMSRNSMTDKSLGEELIIDTEKYFVHPDCKKLYVFVYDKEHRLKNYKAIKYDLEQRHKDVYLFFAR